MEDSHLLGEDLPVSTSRLFERLSRIPGYVWDKEINPFRSTYNSWNVFGTRQWTEFDQISATASAGPSNLPSPIERDGHNSESINILRSRANHGQLSFPVVARISTHVVRLEREFHMMRSIVQSWDRDYVHTVRPIDLVRLAPEAGDSGPILVSIVDSPGPNYFDELVTLDTFWSAKGSMSTVQILLQRFVDFAVGACRCLELLHFGLKTAHGEIRIDTFHFSRATGAVKIIHTGNGTRAFDNALNKGWSELSRERDGRTKLQFIAPEQTGRIATEPDTRTDIYALGIVFWTILVGKPPFTGKNAVDVIHNVLGKKLPLVSSIRMDIPDAVSAVIEKMTHKEMTDRYHTITAVKKDIEEIAKLLCNGDSLALSTFQVAKCDVPSFFTLPSGMYGRQEEYDKIIGIVDEVHQRQQAEYIKAVARRGDVNSHTSFAAPSVSEGGVESADHGEALSDAGSFDFLKSGESYHVASYRRPRGSTQSSESVPSTNLSSLLSNRVRSTGDDGNRNHNFLISAITNSHLTPLNPFNQHKPYHKQRRSGRCEVITISGCAGIGKSDLIQRVQPAIRKQGYIGISRLDRTQRIPFEPFAKILASLIRQIFSERHVTSDYHASVRSCLWPLWPMLHRVLELPEHLISIGQEEKYTSKAVADQVTPGSSLTETTDPPDMTKTPSVGDAQNPVEIWLSGASNKYQRLMETYLEILRIMCMQKLICICLDDLQYADDETSDLVINIVKARIPCLVILTARKDEIQCAGIKSLFNGGTVRITNIHLDPLVEEDVMKYVAATVHQPPNPSLKPLSAVIMEKCGGNILYIRAMLETCYRKQCIWYSWRHSGWQFDMDRIFTEFVSHDHGGSGGLDIIAKGFQEMPSEARAILVWASFLGSSFSFYLVQNLLNGDFWPSSAGIEKDPYIHSMNFNPADLICTNDDAIAGLQYLVQLGVVIPGETDDEFRFAHDRFAYAVSTMAEVYDTDMMNFAIAQTMMKCCVGDKYLYSTANHICQSVRLIKDRVKERSRYRIVIQEAAQMAMRSGARPTTLFFFRNCLDLLQSNCWDDSLLDVNYHETLQLHMSTADVLWHQGHQDEALALLGDVFEHSRTAPEKSKAWILKSRIYTRAGHHQCAMDALLASLEELGAPIHQPHSYQECDDGFIQLKQDLRNAGNIEELMKPPTSTDENLIAIGNVMAEALGVAYWGDDLRYLQMNIWMLRFYLSRGQSLQGGLGCSLMAGISYCRYKDREMAVALSDLALSFVDSSLDFRSQALNLGVHTTMVGHLQMPISASLPALEHAVQIAFASGDPHPMRLTFGSLALVRLQLGQDMPELEKFCAEAPEQLGNWMHDTRWGVFIVAVRQVARALQGKTSVSSPDLIMDDDQHVSVDYIEHINQQSTGADRPLNIYWGLAVIPLYTYGHYEKAIELGTSMVDSINRLWSLRIRYSVKFYLSLSILTRHLKHPIGSDMDLCLDNVFKYQEEIEFARTSCNANYGMWSSLLEALLCEIRQESRSATKAYEASIQHCEIYGFPLEKSLTLELYGDSLIRGGSMQPARAMIQAAIAAWTTLGASGKAAQLSQNHMHLLRSAPLCRTMDAGCQTVGSFVDIAARSAAESAAVLIDSERERQWVELNSASEVEESVDISSVGLDIIDLSTILEFSQLLSSELQVENLLRKMVKIILESCNGSDTVVIATNFEDRGFAIASFGDLENGQKTFLNGLSFSEMDKFAQQILHYALRTREEVLVHNVLEDERFSVLTETYQVRYPLGRSVIALPILQADTILGVIQVEGKPNSFTQRNIVILRLLCNQIGISLSNAFLFRKVQSVSATNAAMVEAQKHALAKARKAEQKAKLAEAEANWNLKLKEDAAKAKSFFLANISHDLRTPMNGIIGLSELIKGTILDKEQDGYIESIRVCADTLLALINDILDLSKLEAGKMHIAAVPFNLRDSISEVICALRYAHRHLKLETIEELDQVPPCLVIIGDPIRLHQILMNLVSNSYKFTPSGSVTVRAKVSPCLGDGNQVSLECSVTDTGIGISAEQKSQLFKPFFQADTSVARSYGGSGLGLSICKAIIDILGGSIWLDSIPGVGTTVTFQFTSQKVPEEAAAKELWLRNFNDSGDPKQPLSGRQNLSSVPRDQIRVCIAEDNLINQKIALKFVNTLGLKCEAFDDGQQALDALRQHSMRGQPFHIVLMDIQMPVLDGYSTTREIRKDKDPNVRGLIVIALTASAIPGDREKCLDAGMDNYLAKPVRLTVLRAMLDQYLAPPQQPKLHPPHIRYNTS